MKNSHSHRWLIFFEVILLIIAFLAAVFLILAGIGPSWQKPEVSVKMQNASEIDPNNAVVLSFSQSVKTSKIEQGFKVSPSADVSLAWKNNNTELEIKPVDYFEPGKEYTLEFPVPRGILGLGKEILNLKYKVRDFPQVTYVVPEKDEASISIDSDFKITFDHSVHDFNINFEMDPEGAFQWETDAEKTTLRIFSENKLAYETAYAMKITAQPSSNGKPAPAKEIFSGTFQTEKKPALVAEKSNSAVIPEDQVVDLYPRVETGKYIDINLAKQHLSIFENASRIGTFRISSGKRGMATPTGNFKILSKTSRAWSNKYKLYMPFWMQFTGMGHGIHELPEWPGGYKEGAAHLGIPVSHGCVRLGIGPAQTVYAWADKGTPVVIHY